MDSADRYVLRGLSIPIIVPGDLRSLERLLKVAYDNSCKVTGQVFRIEAVNGKERYPVRIYKDGQDLTEYDSGDD